MKNIALESFTGEHVTNSWVVIVDNEEILDSAGSLKTGHLSDIYRILKDLNVLRFQLWEFYKYRKLIKFMKLLRATKHEFLTTKGNSSMKHSPKKNYLNITTLMVLIDGKCCDDSFNGGEAHARSNKMRARERKRNRE